VSPWRPLLLDFAAIAIFAAVGRSSHAEGVTVVGVLITAWPFLVGCLVGTLVARIGQASYRISGILSWVSTVIIGMILRVLTGPGTQLSFIIVATITLGVLLLGWRAVIAVIRRRRAPTASRPLDPSILRQAQDRPDSGPFDPSTGSGQARLREH
jgi:hypothetical protein